ncbi:MAG TPA: M56 family metallopeptidase [Puia sp.]|nr:M56 family metallopeptidase [Puia sp.]
MQVLTHFPILKALGWALVNSMWQMAALWVIYALFVTAFQNAAVRHRFALLLLGAGALWTTASFVAAWLFPGSSGAFFLSILSPGQPAAGGFWQNTRRLVEDALPYGTSLYLLVLGSLLVRYGANYRHSRRLTRLGLSAMPPQFRTFVSATALQLGIRVPVKAWLSSLVDVPLTLGLLKPVILLPAAMITHLTPQQVEAILVHELAHIRRRDYLLHLLITVLEGIFFFNPFARLLIRQLKKERENCCDDLVLQFKYDAHAYVSALLSLASRRPFGQKLAVAATGTGDRMLLQRAKRILLPEKGERLRPGLRPLILLAVTALIAALPLYHPLLLSDKPATGIAARTRVIYFVPPKRAAVRASSFAVEPAMPMRPVDLVITQPMILTAPRRVIRRHGAGARLTGHRGNTDLEMAYDVRDPGNGSDLVVKTADDGLLFANSDGAPVAVTVAGGPDPNAVPEATSRDFSMNIPQAAGPAAPTMDGTPFIPNSSFTFQYNEGDSSHSEEQLLYLQQSAQLEVLAAMAKLQQQTAAQLKALTAQLSRATESLRLRNQIRSRQLQLQEDYFKKIQSWQSKLQKSTHIRMIVYI